MKILRVSKAEGVITTEPIEDVELLIDRGLPKFDADEQGGINGLWMQAAYFHEEAKRLEDLLVHSIPGALYEQLLAAMLTRKAAQLIVPLAYDVTESTDTPAAAQRLREKLRELRKELDGYIMRTEQLEREVCGATERGDQDIWQHIAQCAADNKFSDVPNDSQEFLRWAEAVRVAFEQSAPPELRLQVTVAIHSPSRSLLEAARALGWLQTTARDASLSWYTPDGSSTTYLYCAAPSTD